MPPDFAVFETFPWAALLAEASGISMSAIFKKKKSIVNRNWWGGRKQLCPSRPQLWRYRSAAGQVVNETASVTAVVNNVYEDTLLNGHESRDQKAK